MSTVGVVVGNPKPRSRTLEVAEAVAAETAEAVGLAGAPRLTFDLADLGPSLFDWSSTPVREAVDAVRGCSLAVIASPTYKASYTGLLKSFLDWFSTTDLDGVVVVPLMVGAGVQHALAVEVHLRPVLVELGATIPTRGFYVTEGQLGDLDAVVAAWLAEAAPRLQTALAPSSS
jgi:FMN reductase